MEYCSDLIQDILTWFSMLPRNLNCDPDDFVIKFLMSDSDFSACFEGFTDNSESGFFPLHISLHGDIQSTSITNYRLQPYHISIGHALR